MIWAKNAPKNNENTKLLNSFYSLRLIFSAYIHISVKYLNNSKKKCRNFSLKTRESKKKNKKKIGSNDENLRKFEPQQKQRVLIKKEFISK